MRMPCSPKTMLKIGTVIAVPLAVGFIVFPQLRAVILSLAPFAIFALCPLAMLFGMKGMTGEKQSNTCSSCGHDHVSGVKHVQAKEEE